MRTIEVVVVMLWLAVGTSSIFRGEWVAVFASCGAALSVGRAALLEDAVEDLKAKRTERTA